MLLFLASTLPPVGQCFYETAALSILNNKDNHQSIKSDPDGTDINVSRRPDRQSVHERYCLAAAPHDPGSQTKPVGLLDDDQLSDLRNHRQDADGSTKKIDRLYGNIHLDFLFYRLIVL